MGEQLSIVAEPTPADLIATRVASFRRAAEAAAKYVKEPGSKRTRRAYKSAWEKWGQWCALRGREPLPIEPGWLVIYLQERTHEGTAPATIRLALTALCKLDQAARVTPADREPRSIRRDPIVYDWLDGWSRDNPVAPRRQAPAIQPRDVERILLAAAERPAGASRAQHVALYARDRALILLGVGVAMRIAELVALDLGHVQITERGLRVFLPRRKTDQRGRGKHWAVLPQGKIVRCPVDAWRCWLAVRGEQSGPAFQAFARDGSISGLPLDERSARRILVRRARAAGITLSSHSMRATCATVMAAKGRRIDEIADHLGHARLEQTRTYIRQGRLFEDSPTAGLFDD
jgi:integrase